MPADKYIVNPALGHPVTLASGRPVAVGDQPVAVEPDKKTKQLDPHDKTLIDEGALIKVDNDKNKEG